MSDWRVYRTPGVRHPFASTISNDEFVFVTGIGGHHPDGSIDDDAEAQARTSLAKIAALLEEAGSSLDEVVWLRPVVTDREHVAGMNAAFAVFGDIPPGAGALLIAGLVDPRMLVEFDVIAQRGAHRVAA